MGRGLGTQSPPAPSLVLGGGGVGIPLRRAGSEHPSTHRRDVAAVAGSPRRSHEFSQDGVLDVHLPPLFRTYIHAPRHLKFHDLTHLTPPQSPENP